jgi:hypothetical protein
MGLGSNLLHQMNTSYGGRTKLSESNRSVERASPTE